MPKDGGISAGTSKFPKLFNVDLTNVSEIYIDSTHSTNGQNAELFAIIACESYVESGYGVPVCLSVEQLVQTG